MDQWYLDDGLALVHPRMVVGFLRAFDSSSTAKGAERNVEKTKVTMMMSNCEKP